MDKILKPAYAGVTILLMLAMTANATTVPTEWQYSQEIQVTQKGLIKVQLPLETLSNAQPGLSDLRLMDAAGQETSYFIDQPMIEPARQLALLGMTMSMSNGKTIITGQVPPDMAKTGFDTLFLYTSTDDFLKPVTVEGSSDGARWVTLVKAHPIYPATTSMAGPPGRSGGKQPGESVSTRLEFKPGNWSHLRLVLDDTTTPPIRIQGVRLYSAPKPLPGLQSVAVQILETSSDAHQTEIHLLLPADNLTLDAVRLITADGTFRRRVTASVKVFSAGEFREQALAQGVIYRIALNEKSAEGIAIKLGTQVPGRQLILRIENGDSRPLSVSKVAIDVVPAHLVFNAPSAGTYSLWVGNLLAPPRNYDVSSLRDNLRAATFFPAQLSPLMANAAYQAPQPFPQVATEGTDIDVSAWHYRKKVALRQTGIQRIEPDLDVVSHNGGRPAAFRVVQDGKQLPYILDSIGVSRDVEIKIEEAPAKANASRWTLTLPQNNLPVTLLRFTVPAQLFQRTMSLYEDVQDERGDLNRQLIGQASWTQVHGEAKDGYLFQLYRAPRSNKLFLETDNRDNSPIQLTSVRGYYQTPRLLLIAAPGKDLYLYYGNAEAAAPQYDLQLIAHEILATPPSEITLGAEEVLKVKPWWEAPVPTGAMKYGFWAVMALVVIGLLAVIAKLLPAEPADASKP